MFELDPQLASDCITIKSLALSELLLMNDANYPWLILVPRVAGATELIDLGQSEQQQLLKEIDKVSKALRTLFSPDKLNIAALGNMVKQLHVHCIARHHKDPSWPKPVWGQVPPQRYPDVALAERITQLRKMLD